MSVNITFLGGADTVTGSKFLVQHEGQSLLVDCGLFQGYKQLRLRNWRPLPVVPGQIHAVILTHAHLDHSGYLPVLVREGFHGRVHATAGTRDLCGILLPDSGHIQEEDAAFANRHGFSKHTPALPLYTRRDALDCLGRIHAEPFGQTFQPIRGWRATFTPAGHILGAASLLLEVAGHRILFSGDLGRPDDLLMNPPADPPAADTVLIESTYGDRLHPSRPSTPSWPCASRCAGSTMCAPRCSGWLRAGAWRSCRCSPWGERRPCCMPSRSSRPKAPSRAACRCSWTARWPSTLQTCSTSTRTTTG